MDKLGRKRIIMDRANKEPYLIRYYLLFIERKNFPFNIFIHHILKDDDEDLHDHPWGFFSLILNGGYRETILNEKQYTEYGYRGAQELSDAMQKIKELEEELRQVKAELAEERQQREAMVR